MKELLDKDIISTDTITNFRPNISFRGKEVVYLSPSYNIELTTFLGTRIKKNKEALNYLYKTLLAGKTYIGTTNSYMFIQRFTHISNYSFD